MNMNRVIFSSALLLSLTAWACADDTSSFDLPPLNKSGEDTPEITLERVDVNGQRGEWTGALPAGGESAVATFVIEEIESLMVVDVEVSSGEPHVYVRDADDGEVVLEIHGDGGTATGSFVPARAMTDAYQIALFVTDSAGGDFRVTIDELFSCTEDMDSNEPNEHPAAAAPITIFGTHSGVICIGAESSDSDYFRVTVPEPDRILRVDLSHVESFGPLYLVAEGPLGPLEVSRIELPGSTFSGSVMVAFDRVGEATREGDEYVIGVWGDGLFNIYDLTTCLDDGLEDDGAALGNNDAGTASPLLIGTTYSRAVLCPVSKSDYESPVPDDSDYYEVTVPAGRGLRIRATADVQLTFDGPSSALQVSADVWELSPAPTERQVIFGLTAEEPYGPIHYDLAVVAI